jgi:mannose-6-phosphate isomerase-like protein (cupin superfamily)
MEFKGNIEDLTEKNQLYRKVIHTNVKQQLVLMSLLPLQEIGMEVHKHTSQFIRVEEGNGVAIINGHRYILKDGDAVVIPPGSYHNIVNTSRANEMKLYTVYSPPHHPVGTKQRVKPKED